jgi:hypothetical protein
MSLKSMLRLTLAMGLCLVLGCAKFPLSGGSDTKRLRFIIRFNSAINPNYVYIVAINDANDETGVQGGPIPVIAPPWGNGFVAGKATHFIVFGNFPGTGGGYLIYKFTDPNLVNYVPIGLPVSYVIPDFDDDTLEFEIDLAQIRPPPADAKDIFALQVNILTMDRVPTDPGDTNPKIWDAFGNSTDPLSINDYITIDVTIDRTYSNADLNIEPTGDTSLPPIDIVDFSIQIRSP